MKNLIITIACLIICISCSENSTAPQSQEFDFYLDRFNIIDDGYYLNTGNFYYNVSITDIDGNILKDYNGNNCVLSTDINSTVEVSSGGILPIQKTIRGIKLKKESGQSFIIKIKLYEVYALTNVNDAGYENIFYNYPWSSNINQDRIIKLLQSSDDYETEVVFMVEKK